jgi:hypothetical protein
MSLAAAIQAHSSLLSKSTMAYNKEVMLITSQMAKVYKTELPAFDRPPPCVDEFAKALTDAKVKALGWTNDVYAQLLAAPKTVATFNTGIADCLIKASHCADALVKDPKDGTNKTLLLNYLNMASEALGTITDTVSGVAHRVANFDDHLPDLATKLEAIASQAVNLAQVDQEKIHKLQIDVDKLNEKIKALITELAILGTGSAGLLVVGIGASVAIPEVGWLVWFIIGPAELILGYVIVKKAFELAHDQEELAKDLADINSFTKDVATLKLMSKGVSDLANGTKGIEAAASDVLKGWKSMQSAVESSIDDIRDALKQANLSSYSKVKDDLTKAAAAWATTVAEAKLLTLDVEVANVAVHIGMPQEAMKKAIADAPKVPILTYLREAAAAA